MEKLELIRTSQACPEQYDVLIDGQPAGYLRLRRSVFCVDYPESGGETVYQAEPNGDGRLDDGERGKYIGAALAVLIDRHER